MQTAIEFRCLPLRQRSGTSPCGKLIDALPVRLRKLHRPKDTGRHPAVTALWPASITRARIAASVFGVMTWELILLNNAWGWRGRSPFKG